MSSKGVLEINSEGRGPQLKSVEAEATSRLRLATAVSLLAETILPAVEATLFARPDWLSKFKLFGSSSRSFYGQQPGTRALARSGNPRCFCFLGD